MAALRLGSIGFLIIVALAVGLLLGLLPDRISRSLSNALTCGFCRLACKALGISVEAVGAPPVDGPTLLVSNHISWTDVLALGSLSPMIFLARHDLAGWPLLGRLARAYGTLFVERGRRRQIPEVNRQMAEQMASAKIVVLFPEGTTGDGTRLQKFNSSHFAAPATLLANHPQTEAVTVAPVALAYTRQGGLPLGRTGRAAIAWYGDTEFVPHLLDLVRGGKTTCRISFLPTRYFDRGTDRKTVARQTALVIQTAFRSEIMSRGAERSTTYVQSTRQVV